MLTTASLILSTPPSLQSFNLLQNILSSIITSYKGSIFFKKSIFSSSLILFLAFQYYISFPVALSAPFLLLFNMKFGLFFKYFLAHFRLSKAESKAFLALKGDIKKQATSGLF